MFREFFDIEENPFSNTPDPKYLFMSQRHKEALAHLIYGVEGDSGFVLLTGEVGTGKTTLCRYLAESLPDGVELALCINPRLSEVELLASICDDMGISVSGSRSSITDLTGTINTHLLDVHARGDQAVLIIDEAQVLSFDLLEQIRLLTNLETADSKLLQIILIGQPELKETLDRQDLRQLSQRVTARYHLDPLTRRETRDYISHRLGVAELSPAVFQSSALTEIYEASRGIPRLINSICERCLLGAYAAGTKHIDAQLARKAAAEVLGHELPSRPSLMAPISAAIAVSLVGAAFVLASPYGAEKFPRISRLPVLTALRQEIQSWPSLWNLIPGGGENRENAPEKKEPTQQTSDKLTVAALLDSDQPEGGFDAGLTGLFALWKLASYPKTGLDPCTDMEAIGLKCLQGTGAWVNLRRINHPALIRLEGAEGRAKYAVVSALDESKITLEMDGRRIDAAPADVAPFWSGYFLVLWQAPKVYWRSIEPGMTGDDVVWLRIRLAEIAGQSAHTSAPKTYGDELRIQVDRFKRSHNLPDDGIVDPLTVIQFNNSTGGPTAPGLRP